MESQSLAVTRGDYVDCLRYLGHDLSCSVACFIFMHWRETRQALSPNMLSFKSRDRSDARPIIVDFQEFNAVAQRIAQQHMPLACSVQNRMFGDHQESLNRR